MGFREYFKKDKKKKNGKNNHLHTAWENMSISKYHLCEKLVSKYKTMEE